MPDITCPECGQRTELLAVRRDAGEFCSHCDFPLFWAATSVPAMERGANSDSTLRRLPGAGGRQRVGTRICPTCGELNHMGEIHCIRCTSELDPKPVPPPAVAAPLPPPEPVPVVVPEVPMRRWDYWILAGFLVAAMVVAVVVSI